MIWCFCYLQWINFYFSFFEFGLIASSPWTLKTCYFNVCAVIDYKRLLELTVHCWKCCVSLVQWLANFCIDGVMSGWRWGKIFYPHSVLKDHFCLSTIKIFLPCSLIRIKASISRQTNNSFWYPQKSLQQNAKGKNIYSPNAYAKVNYNHKTPTDKTSSNKTP